MFENFIEIIHSFGIELSFFIVLTGALILYFGKIIGDTRVEKYDKLGYYIEGLLFSIIFLFVSFVLAYSLRGFTSLPFWAYLLLQIIMFSLLSWNFKANEYLKKLGLIHGVETKMKDKIEELKTSSRFGYLIKKYENSGWDYVNLFILSAYKIPIKIFGNALVLLFMSFLTISASIHFFDPSDILAFAVSSVFTFFILTLIAFAYGYRNVYYPPAKIYFEKGKHLEGKILKIGDFIYVLKGDKKFFVNKDKVKYVEESLFKNKKPE